MPQGWKRKGDKLYCSPCWNKRYILRAVAIAVAAPMTGTWQELRASLRLMWAQTTQASNWIMSELYARDIKRVAQEKMDTMPPAYLYPEVRERFPALPSQTCAALEKAVTAKYQAKRAEVIWWCSASLPTHRYPTPFPVPNQGWSVRMEGEQPVVSLRVGDSRIELKLRYGAPYRRQLQSVRSMISGEAETGQMDIYAQGKDIMCKMVAWLPRSAPVGERSNILPVRSTAESLIVALNASDEKLWTYNGDQVRRWIAEHRRRLQRWGEDGKAEHRPDPPFAKRRTEATIKYRHRMSSACHQIAMMITGYAVRRKFAGVKFDDTDRSFCPQFVWATLAGDLRQKLDAAGLTFEYVTSAADEATGIPSVTPDTVKKKRPLARK